MRRRDATMVKGGTRSADLLACFPHRAHLTVMPTNAICSPGRPSDKPRAVATCPQPVGYPHHRRSKSSSNGKVPQASPVLWVTTKHAAASEMLEPTSPKVTCAGQIKVKTKNGGANPCKGWQSAMQEIEWIHKDGNRKKRPTWGEALGFNKDVAQFLTCLQSLKFSFRCFGNFPQVEITSDDEEEDDDDQEEDDVLSETDIRTRDGSGGNGNGDARTFSKWFMVLQENNTKIKKDDILEGEVLAPAVPPSNALLLMRSRSAPAKSWAVEADGVQRNDDSENRDEAIKKNLKILIEEEKKVGEEEGRNKVEGLARASYDADYCKISTDIVKETWIVGGFNEVLSKSRSWKI